MPLLALEACHVQLALESARTGGGEHPAVVAHDIGFVRFAFGHGAAHDDVQAVALRTRGEEVHHGGRLVGERADLLAHGPPDVAEREQLHREVLRQHDELAAVVGGALQQGVDLLAELGERGDGADEVLDGGDAPSLHAKPPGWGRRRRRAQAGCEPSMLPAMSAPVPARRAPRP